MGRSRSKFARIDHVWIELENGIKLGGRLWLPKGRDETRFPTLLEYQPYRSCDFTAYRDAQTYDWLAEQGYACLKVDVRGTANSDGLHSEQFSEEYVDDALLALRWIAKQTWSNEKVGMIGLSWSAHAALMVATKRPPQLSAIMPQNAADDRFLNKYQGGCLLLYSVWWGAIYGSMQARPPLPWIVGEGWRDRWLERLEHAFNHFESWISHPNPNDEYWSVGSVARHYARISCPVFYVAGWADPGYAMSAPRLMDGLNVTNKSLVGAWGHCVGHHARPGPGIDILGEVVRWFDRWLKGRPTGVEDDPKLFAWMYDVGFPDPAAQMRPGRWVTSRSWPLEDVQTEDWFLSAGRLSSESTGDGFAQIRSPLSVGASAGEWMPWFFTGLEPELPSDQRFDDGGSLLFDSDILNEDLELLGATLVDLVVSSDKDCGQVVARLCAVAPDGTSSRITFGFASLVNRTTGAGMQPVYAGQQYDLRMELYPTGFRVPKGYKLRLAISSSYWPIIWPAREHATITVYARGSRLRLPRYKGSHSQWRFKEPTFGAGRSRTEIRPARSIRQVIHDIATGISTILIQQDGGRHTVGPDGLEIGSGGKLHFEIQRDDPTSAVCKTEWYWHLKRDTWDVSCTIRSEVHSDCDDFIIVNSLEGTEAGERCYSRSWNAKIPRQGI
jgi:putative CocE/NonD family hydrolase